MKVPNAADLIRVWELGRGRPDWFRGLLLLAPAFPEESFASLARLTLGRRNIRLFRLRECLFGSRLTAIARCPACGKSSEVSADIDDFCPRGGEGEAACAENGFMLQLSSSRFACRCPTSEDLAALEHEPEPVLESRALAARCATAAAPLELIEPLREAWHEHDPLIQLTLGIACSECAHDWSLAFDCVTFLWTEVSNAAQRLLDDVHVLASRYGWREVDILAMSAIRRRFYLERAEK